MTVYLSLPLATRFVSIGVKQVIRYRLSGFIRFWCGGAFDEWPIRGYQLWGHQQMAQPAAPLIINEMVV